MSTHYCYTKLSGVWRPSQLHSYHSSVVFRALYQLNLNNCETSYVSDRIGGFQLKFGSARIFYGPRRLKLFAGLIMFVLSILWVALSISKMKECSLVGRRHNGLTKIAKKWNVMLRANVCTSCVWNDVNIRLTLLGVHPTNSYKECLFHTWFIFW